MNCRDCINYYCASCGADFESPDCVGVTDDELIDIDLTRTIFATEFVATMEGEPDEVEESTKAFCEELSELLQKYFGDNWAYEFDVEDD